MTEKIVSLKYGTFDDFIIDCEIMLKEIDSSKASRARKTAIRGAVESIVRDMHAQSEHTNVRMFVNSSAPSKVNRLNHDATGDVSHGSIAGQFQSVSSALFLSRHKFACVTAILKSLFDRGCDHGSEMNAKLNATKNVSSNGRGPIFGRVETTAKAPFEESCSSIRETSNPTPSEAWMLTRRRSASRQVAPDEAGPSEADTTFSHEPVSQGVIDPTHIDLTPLIRGKNIRELDCILPTDQILSTTFHEQPPNTASIMNNAGGGDAISKFPAPSTSSGRRSATGSQGRRVLPRSPKAPKDSLTGKQGRVGAGARPGRKSQAFLPSALVAVHEGQDDGSDDATRAVAALIASGPPSDGASGNSSKSGRVEGTVGSGVCDGGHDRLVGAGMGGAGGSKAKANANANAKAKGKSKSKFPMPIPSHTTCETTPKYIGVFRKNDVYGAKVRPANIMREHASLSVRLTCSTRCS